MGDNKGSKRSNNRWLRLAYDSVIYAACWLLVFGLCNHLNIGAAIFTVIGYLLFLGARLLFGVYKSVLRNANLFVFAKLILADTVSAALILLIALFVWAFFPIYAVSIYVLCGSIVTFVLISIVVRVFYCCAYRFAQGKSTLAKFVRYVLEHFAFVDFDSPDCGATLRLSWDYQETVPTYVNELQWVADKFTIHGRVTSITQLNSGYINRTYRVETLSQNGRVHKYTMQRINTNVFRDPELLMQNYKFVTEELYTSLKISEKQNKSAVQTLKSTKDGQAYLADASGYWRMMTYFDNVYSMDIPSCPEVFERAGYAFGNFIKAMADTDISLIKEVIPNFHNTKSRYRDLEKSIAEHADGRAREVMPEIEFIRARADKFGVIADALENGEIPKRICHNDCNLNNILFDDKTHIPVAIIDLDTVMPSSPLYDFGDSMRIGTNTAKDDEKDLSKVSCNLVMYEHYARGYLMACGNILTERELELLPAAALVITIEDGIRFLMDHIDGDIYYKISYPGQNLDRARTQLKLVGDMETKLPEIKKILRKIYKDLGLTAQI